MSTSRIWKTLPNGKRAHKYVTREEFINDGWARNGWATNILEWQQAADSANVNHSFKEQFQHTDTRTLALYSRYVDIIKQLPNGKYVKRNIPYGQFATQGWEQNGWRLAGRLTRPGFTPTKSFRQEAIRKLRGQNWWKPSRSQDQARMLSPTKTESEISQLRNIDNIPNPYHRRWARRKTGHEPLPVINRYVAFKRSIPSIAKKNIHESFEDRALKHDLYLMTHNPYHFWV